MKKFSLSYRVRLYITSIVPSVLLFGVIFYFWRLNPEAVNKNIITTLFLVSAILVAFAFMTIRRITHTLYVFKRDTRELIDSRDMSKRILVDSADDFGQVAQNINCVLENFEILVADIGELSNTLADSSAKIEQISQQTSQDVSRQLHETEQAATAMNEMTSTVQEVARNALEASKSANKADDQASLGSQVVQQVIQAINELDKEIETTANVIHTVEEETDNIGSVLDVIRGIAEQTNLLALNAAIEAARAGEQGRGFAVVADEVRTLASRTQQSTQEIQTMIERLQNGVKNAVVAMGKGQEKVKGSVSKAESAGQSLDEINKAVTTITAMNTQIANASEDQSNVAEEINKNVSVIKDISTLSFENADKSAVTINKLNNCATKLNEIYHRFQS